MVDFYYMDSVNWKSLSGFNIFPEHDPHFIIVTGVSEESVIIIDPYYNYQGTISIEKFQMARRAKTRQGNVDFRSYELHSENLKTVDVIEILKFSFERFLKERMYYQIEEMAGEIDKKRLIEGKRQNRHWALNGYNCLRSAVHQHSNINELAKKNNIYMISGFDELENRWALIRKKLFSFYTNRFDALEDISYMIFKTAKLEKEYAKVFLDSSL